MQMNFQICILKPSILLNFRFKEVGYHGVPARETKESIENVVR